MKTLKELTEKYYSIKNTRAITAKFIPCSNTKGARIKIYDNYMEDRKQSVFLSYDYEISDVAIQAYKFLIQGGFNVVCRSSNVNEYIFLVDNWNDNYINIKDVKK